MRIGVRIIWLVLIATGCLLLFEWSLRASAQTAPATQAALPGAGKVVALDYFYNHQVDKDGKQFAYIWEDTGPLGYSQFGEIWKKAGATLAHMDHAPTRADLDRVSVYIIASPSNEQNAAGHKPNYIEQPAIDAIVQWVKDGGVLAIFANNSDACDLENLNKLTKQFGISFGKEQCDTVPKPGDTVVEYHGEQVAENPEEISYSGGPKHSEGFPNRPPFQNGNTSPICNIFHGQGRQFAG